MPDRGLPFQRVSSGRRAIVSHFARHPSSWICCLLDLAVSRTYAVGKRYGYGNHRSGVTLNGKWLREDENAAELAISRVEKPVTEEAVGIYRNRRGRGRQGLT